METKIQCGGCGLVQFARPESTCQRCDAPYGPESILPPAGEESKRDEPDRPVFRKVETGPAPSSNGPVIGCLALAFAVAVAGFFLDLGMGDRSGPEAMRVTTQDGVAELVLPPGWRPIDASVLEGVTLEAVGAFGAGEVTVFSIPKETAGPTSLAEVISRTDAVLESHPAVSQVQPLGEPRTARIGSYEALVQDLELEDDGVTFRVRSAAIETPTHLLRVNVGYTTPLFDEHEPDVEGILRSVRMVTED
jgi:hypothetical protein